MAERTFKPGDVVWARFGKMLYPAVVEPLPDPSMNGKQYMVGYFPDFKSRSYVKYGNLWDYREYRDKYASDKSFTRTKDWRSLLTAADKYLGITLELPESRASTRASNGEMNSEVGLTVAEPKKTLIASSGAQIHAEDAIELPDEDQPDAEDSTESIKHHLTNGDSHVANGSTSSKTSSKRKAPEKKKVATSKPANEEELVNGSVSKKAKQQPERSSGKNVDANKKTRGRPSLKSDGATQAQESGRSSPRLKRRSEAPPPSSTRGKRTPEPHAAATSRSSLPPIIGSTNGNASFDNAFNSVQRNISSTDLLEMPKVLPPGKQNDFKSVRNLDGSFDDHSLRFGFIGLQSLSLIIVRHLRAAGKQSPPVYVWDSNQAVVKQAVSLGATACNSKAEVIDLSDTIFTSLLNEKDAHEAFFTPGDGIMACVGPSKGIVDLGTPNIAYVEQINGMLTDRRVPYLYCAVFGNIVDAADAKLSFCVAGSSRLYKDIADLLRSLGGTYDSSGHWDDPSMALKAKCVSDMLVAAENLAFCEALAMASRIGLPADFMLKVMRHQTKDHFSQCLPAEASRLGSEDLAGHSKNASDATCLLPHSLSATVTLSPDRGRGPSLESLRSLTTNVNYAAAFAQCFNSLANESGASTNSLFVAMHAIISARANGHGSEDMSSLFQRLSSLI